MSNSKENRTAHVAQPSVISGNKPGAMAAGSDIRLCPDGKYRWYYEYPMLKNPTILFTLWKVMLIAALAPGLVVLLSGLSGGFLEALKQAAAVFGITFGVLFLLSCIGYLIIAAAYGFTYIVLFEMDNESVTHIQQGRQFKKAWAIGWLAALGGAANGNPGAVGAGMLAAGKQKMTSEFKNVSTVIGCKNRDTIKVNQTFAKNQVYVEPADYDFVWDYITSRCPNAKLR